MAIKVKHEGNATSRLTAAGAGGKGRRRAEDAKLFLQIASQENMANRRVAEPRFIQAHAQGPSSAPLVHAQTGVQSRHLPRRLQEGPSRTGRRRGCRRSRRICRGRRHAWKSRPGEAGSQPRVGAPGRQGPDHPQVQRRADAQRRRSRRPRLDNGRHRPAGVVPLPRRQDRAGARRRAGAKEGGGGAGSPCRGCRGMGSSRRRARRP